MWKSENPLSCLEKITFFSAFPMWILQEKYLCNFVEKKSTTRMCVNLCEFCEKRDNDVYLLKSVRDVATLGEHSSPLRCNREYHS